MGIKSRCCRQAPTLHPQITTTAPSTTPSTETITATGLAAATPGRDTAAFELALADELVVGAADDERIADVGIGTDTVGNVSATDVDARLQNDCASASADAMGAGAAVVDAVAEAEDDGAGDVGVDDGADDGADDALAEHDGSAARTQS